MKSRQRILNRVRFFGYIICSFVVSISCVRVHFPNNTQPDLDLRLLVITVGCFVFASCISGLTYCVLFWMMKHVRQADPMKISQALATVIPMGLLAPGLTFMLFRASGIAPPILPIPPTVFPWIVVTLNLAMFLKGIPPTKERLRQWKYLGLVVAAIIASIYISTSLQPEDLLLLVPGIAIVWALAMLGLGSRTIKVFLMSSAFCTFLCGLGMVSVGVFETKLMAGIGILLVALVCVCGLLAGDHLNAVEATIPERSRRRHARGGRHRRGSHAMPSPSPSISVRYPG